MISLIRQGKFGILTELLKNPETIVIKNKFYPSGLTEMDVKKYYDKNKRKILNENFNRDVMLFIKTEKDVIVRRKKKGGFFKLTDQNYEREIHGRVISIHSTMNHDENIGIVDIDINDFSKAKSAAAAVYDHLSTQNLFRKVTIRYTGKESFHIVCEFDTVYSVNKIRPFFRKILKPKFADTYDIESRRQTGKVNLDLSSNKYRGGFITLNSLSVWGLRCMEVPRGKILSFNQSSAKIK